VLAQRRVAVNSPRRRRRNRQRGFSLLIVFMLVLVMVGAAGILMSGLSGQFQVAGQDREQATALYAAEFAVAQAKAFIANQPSLYGGASGWTPLLTSSDPQVQLRLCQPLSATPTANAAPGTSLKNTNGYTALYVDAGGVAWSSWAYCYHNNAEDAGYLNPMPAGSYTGDTNDTNDPMHLLIVEAYGTGPNGAVSHVAVTIGAPGSTVTQGSDPYAQEGGSAQHGGATGSGEKGVGVLAGSITY
jgi:Tfp pilus assembly protein PilX